MDVCDHDFKSLTPATASQTNVGPVTSCRNLWLSIPTLVRFWMQFRTRLNPIRIALGVTSQVPSRKPVHFVEGALKCLEGQWNVGNAPSGVVKMLQLLLTALPLLAEPELT